MAEVGWLGECAIGILKRTLFHYVDCFMCYRIFNIPEFFLQMSVTVQPSPHTCIVVTKTTTPHRPF